MCREEKERVIRPFRWWTAFGTGPPGSVLSGGFGRRPCQLKWSTRARMNTKKKLADSSPLPLFIFCLEHTPSTFFALFFFFISDFIYYKKKKMLQTCIFHFVCAVSRFSLGALASSCYYLLLATYYYVARLTSKLSPFLFFFHSGPSFPVDFMSFFQPTPSFLLFSFFFSIPYFFFCLFLSSCPHILFVWTFLLLFSFSRFLQISRVFK